MKIYDQHFPYKDLRCLVDKSGTFGETRDRIWISIHTSETEI
jgi:hypothetical protein